MNRPLQFWPWISGAILAVLLTAALAACGSEEATPTSVPPAATAVPTTAPDVASPTPGFPTPPPTQVVSTGPVSGGALRQALPLSMKNLDPFRRTDWREQQVVFVLYNGLVKAAQDLTVAPDLAQSWVVSDDGMSLSFQLARNVTFHDGSALTAQSVKWNIDKIMDPDWFAGAARSLIAPALDRVEVVDDYNITFHLKTPFRPLLGNLTTSTIRIISPTAYESRLGNFGQDPSGTGPFKLEEWSPGSHLVLGKNQSYWEPGQPYLDSLRFLNASDRSVQLAMLRTGEAELVDEVIGTELPILEGNPNIRIIPFQTRNWWSMFFQVNNPPFDNKALRQAIAYALNRQQIVDVHLGGQGAPAYSNGNFWYADPDYTPFKYDPTKAREKLAEAGYSSGVTVPYWCEASDVELRLCEIIQSMLRDVGIMADIISVPSEDYWQNVNAGNHKWSKMAYFPRPDPDFVMRSTLHSQGARTRVVGYNNPDVDRIIDEAATVYDTSTAGEMYVRAQKIVFDDAAYTGLYYPKTFAAMSTKVQNFQWWTDTLLRLGEVWIERE